MEQPITNIVVSRYNKNVDFVYRINDNKHINVMIYDKENPENQYNIPVNKGNESSVYLKYIVDNYDNLTEFTYFIHDEEYAWHHTGSVVDKYNEAVNSKQTFYNINDLCFWDKPYSLWNELYYEYYKWYSCYVEETIPFHKIPTNGTDFLFNHHGSAQFLVHKDLIRNLPREFYLKLYIWITTTHMSNWLSGRLLEYSWHIFWYIYPNFIKNRGSQ
jgi:hypothetical protein